MTSRIPARAPGTPTRIKSKGALTAPSAPSSKPELSVREQIALKRAEARKATARPASGQGDSAENSEDAAPEVGAKEDEDLLGRVGVRESIERAKSTGVLNLSTRSLRCVPSALFEIHLGLKSDPVIEDEPTLPEAPTPDRVSTRGYYQNQDLETLKVVGNDIEAIQHEISLFGSLKTLDFRKNKLKSVPTTLADLMSLTILDLSHNRLDSLPVDFWLLPSLANLNISHNTFRSLPFAAPLAPGRKSANSGGGGFFAPTIDRATTVLPRLSVLDVSSNQISASSIDRGSLPAALIRWDLSENPLGKVADLMRALATHRKIKELKLIKAFITGFPDDLPEKSFASLKLLDLTDTQVTAEGARNALAGIVSQELDFDHVEGEAPAGHLRVSVGKKDIREPWEIEAERRMKSRTVPPAAFEDTWAGETKKWDGGTRKGATVKAPVVKEQWEIDAEQGPMTEGAKRRARAMAASAAAEVEAESKVASTSKVAAPPAKEQWEIDAEQGLSTEGGRRRARAQAAVAEAQARSAAVHTESATSTYSLANSEHYSQNTQTLTLPPSTKVPAHARAFSLASSSSFTGGDTSLRIPVTTMPLAVISSEPFSRTLKVLILKNRRMDPTFNIPANADGRLLPNLEELSLEGCSLKNSVAVSTGDALGSVNEPLIPLVSRLFPSIIRLDLSYNVLTSEALSTEVLSTLIMSSSSSDPPRRGLKQLCLKGNRITELDGLEKISELFRGNREVPTWRLDELDVRENEISKLPPTLGLLPLDVFRVDGNVFRVPPARVWEREGTKGLLAWLRGRIE